MSNKELVPLKRAVWIRSEYQSGYCPHCDSFMEVEGEKKREKDL